MCSQAWRASDPFAEAEFKEFSSNADGEMPVTPWFAPLLTLCPRCSCICEDEEESAPPERQRQRLDVLQGCRGR